MNLLHHCIGGFDVKIIMALLASQDMGGFCLLVCFANIPFAVILIFFLN